MNKSELIEALSKKENLTEKKAMDVVNLLFNGFTEELKRRSPFFVLILRPEP